MYTLNDVRAKFPEVDSCGGDLMVRINNENVVLATLGNGSFNMTAKGLELMGVPEIKVTGEVKAEVRSPKGKAKKVEPEAPPAEEPQADTLDTILGE